MADLRASERAKLPDSAFAYIDASGRRRLPINDEAHVRNAIARFDQTDFENASAKQAAAKRIIAAAKRHDIEIADDDDVVKASKS